MPCNEKVIRMLVSAVLTVNLVGLTALHKYIRDPFDVNCLAVGHIYIVIGK